MHNLQAVTAIMVASILTGCGGGGSSSNVQAPVTSVNIPPVSSAGSDQTVAVGANVTLSGSGSDSDGTISTYTWTQTSGTSVTINDSAAASAGFSAPTVSGNEVLSFTLTVTDNVGATSADTVDITVEERIAVSVTAKPDAVTKSAYAIFEFSADTASGFECKLDAADFTSCTSPHSVFPVATGDHTLTIRAMTQDGTAGQEVPTQWTVSSIFGDTVNSDIHPDLLPAPNVTPDPVAPNSWRGIMRINCDFSHSSYDDPVVFPGQDEVAHLHRFYGNLELDHESDIESLFTSGESSCQGNTLNRSAYWYPALLAPSYDAQSGGRLLNSEGDPAFKAVSAVVGEDDVAHEVFYYSAGVDDLESIQPIPLGLKMIAGNGAAVPGQEQDTSVVRWHCQSWESSDATNPRWSTTIPECVAPDRLRMDIFFPSCWDGENLDSEDHKSHLTYPSNPSGTANGTVCPANHPVPIIRVSFHYAFGVKPDAYDPGTLSSRGWRLASDMYDVSTQSPGGLSLHADWFNAWNPEALQMVLDSCIKGGLDCHDGNLANGTRLSGTQPGTQHEPEVVNMGHHSAQNTGSHG